MKRSKREEMVFLSREQVSALALAISNPVLHYGDKSERTYTKHYPEYGHHGSVRLRDGAPCRRVAALQVQHIDIRNRESPFVAQPPGSREN